MFPSPDQSSITVLPTGTDVKEAQVICVSTGTKCINGEYMSDRGLALNDCHAEIIARRSLIRYLYTQLEFFLRSVDSLCLFSSVTIQAFKVFLSWYDRIGQFKQLKFPAIKLILIFVSNHFSNNKEDHQKSIFVQCEKGGYRLKHNVQFHLYISTSPCGDARIFSPHEAGVEGTEHHITASYYPYLSSSFRPADVFLIWCVLVHSLVFTIF